MPLLSRQAAIAAQAFGLNGNIKVKFAKQEYTTAGSYTFTVPPGNTSLIITASGAGAAGQLSYWAGPPTNWVQSNGAAGGNTTVTNGTFNITANGGAGGYGSAAGGTVSISGATSTTLNQTGGGPSGGTGGSSYYGSGSTQGGSFSKPATPTYSAGGGAGFQNIGGVPTPPDNYGGSAGGTGIIVVPVIPGQIINITVGAGATGGSVNYTKGSNYGSYAGNGGVGYASIEMT
jgi:hypothetical protein